MSDVQRWVVVGEDGAVVGGPYAWDGEAQWSPPVEGRLVLESEWLAQQAAAEPAED